MTLLQRFKAWAVTRPAKFILTLLVLLIALRIALPYILLHYANRELAELKGYYGHIDDLSLSLYRGAYTLDSIYINKIEENTNKQLRFFKSDKIDLSIEWKSLFKGSVVGEIILEEPLLQFTENRVELEDVARDSSDFRELLDDFMPIHVNRCVVRNGHLIYADYTADPHIELEATQLHAVAHNLRNAYKSDELLPATLRADAHIHGGTAVLNMRINPLSKNNDFDMDVEVKKAQLPQLNPFFEKYANVDVNKGTFNMYMEAAAKDAKFVGYVKPFIEDLDVLQWKGQDKKDRFFKKVWEGIAGFGGKILENPKNDQIATKIPLEGYLKSETGIQSNAAIAVKNILRNAFFKALQPNFDYEISIRSALGMEKKSDKKEDKKPFRLFKKRDKKQD